MLRRPTVINKMKKFFVGYFKTYSGYYISKKQKKQRYRFGIVTLGYISCNVIVLATGIIR